LNKENRELRQQADQYKSKVNDLEQHVREQDAIIKTLREESSNQAETIKSQGELMNSLRKSLSEIQQIVTARQ
jgi:SMC interacting uncharacterized protein involved in chromosome segregation